MSEKNKNWIEDLLSYGFAKAYLFVLTLTVAVFNLLSLITFVIMAWWSRIK